MINDPRLAMRKIVTSVSILMATSQDVVVGCTISSLVAIDIRLESFQVLFALSASSSTGKVLLESQRFSVNVLTDEMAPLANFYSGEREAHKAVSLPDYISIRKDTPVLNEALVCMNCRLVKVIQFDSSNLFVASVQDFEVRNEDSPLVYLNREYRKLMK